MGRYNLLVLKAVEKNDFDTLSYWVIERKWSVNKYDPGTLAPLSMACRNNNNEMISFLILWGANVDVQSSLPVKICIRNCNRRGLQLLMDANLDINANTVLELAIQKYVEKLKLRQLEHPEETVLQIDPNDPEDKKDDGDELKRSRGIIRDILDYNVDFGFTIFAARQPEVGHLPLVARHREMDTRIERREQMDDAPEKIKQLVNEYQHRQRVEYLATLDTSKAKNVNLQDEHGRTALHRAMKNGQWKAVAYLISTKNAREDLKDKWGRTASECLEATYWDMKMKLDSPDRNYARDLVRTERLADFRRIGRFLAERRDFLKRIGPGIRTTDVTYPFFPSDIVRNFAAYIFS